MTFENMTFEEELDNLINAFDCDYDGYIISRKNFVEKYAPQNTSVEPVKPTIRKKIADEIDEKRLDSYILSKSSDEERLYELSDELYNWISETDDWMYIIDAYLAGKALGIELVKLID